MSERVCVAEIAVHEALLLLACDPTHQLKVDSLLPHTYAVAFTAIRKVFDSEIVH